MDDEHGATDTGSVSCGPPLLRFLRVLAHWLTRKLSAHGAVVGDAAVRRYSGTQPLAREWEELAGEPAGSALRSHRAAAGAPRATKRKTSRPLPLGGTCDDPTPSPVPQR
jgi:hypothetical protein